ncbi:MAG: phosphatidate cytidylyltransferase [candidate division Zixibacteria bacterium]|nr:phosphatidate cytidylyltransferase [candidate division Zixibacteria bacterium]
MSRNLVARIAVAIVAIPVILWICYRGGIWLFGMVLLFALVGAVEFLLNEGLRPRGLLFWLSLLGVGLLLATRYRPATEAAGILRDDTLPVMIALFLVTGMVLATGRLSPPELFRRHGRLMWGMLYIGLLYPCVYLVGAELGRPATPFAGGDLLLFLFGLLWVGDTAAMGTGKWLGRHKLAPSVSPNKTIEGFIGGLAGALAIGVVMHFWRLPQLALVHVLSLALGCSVFGQLGDLVESMWKRSLQIKDSSSIIPGHGGVLDRFDSLLFAAPFMYYYLRIVVL